MIRGQQAAPTAISPRRSRRGAARRGGTPCQDGVPRARFAFAALPRHRATTSPDGRGDRPTAGGAGSAARARGRLALAGLVLAGVLVGCGDAPGIRAEPRALVFTPAADRLELRLVNSAEAPVPLSRIRLDPRAPDWGAFMIEDRELPRAIPPGDAVTLHFRVDRKHFGRRGARDRSPPAVERPGHARLLFSAGEVAHVVELRYDPPDPAADLRRALARTALLLLLVGAGAAALWRARAGMPPWTRWLPALVVFALIPLGPGLCPAALGLPLSAADLEQCAAGRGGQPLALVTVGEGWLVYLVALVLAALGHLVRSTPAAVKLAWRDLALAGAFAGPLLAFATFDPRELVLAQAAGLFGTPLPGWGIFVQPIAAAVALAVVAGSPRVGLERLAFAAAFTAFFLGGAALPGLGPTTHAVALLLGIAVFAVKLAAVAWLVQRLHAAPAGSRARAALLLLGRASIPLAVVSLLGTSAYALWR